MSEAAVVTPSLKILKRRGAWGFVTHGTGATRRGIPDWTGTYRAVSVVIEFKDGPRGKLSRLQIHELDRARKAGAKTLVARNPQDVTDLLDRIDRSLDIGIAA